MNALPPLGLYIHLPWCARKCPYCDFNSHEAATLPEADYVAALLRDVDRHAPEIAGRQIDTVFIGGGTPSLFSAQAIDTLLSGVAARVALASDVEISMEANPGSAEASKFAGFRAAGVNRLSLGIQSFDDTLLQALGRVHDSRQALAAVDHAQRAGFRSVNLDLMHGLPGQSVDVAMADLQQAIAFAPQHLSWYQLTIEPNTVFHSRPPVLPQEDTLAGIQDAGEALLADAGYEQYEVSAYCRAGMQCRHNRNYWTFGDYLGVGAGAHGKLTSVQGEVRRIAKRRQPAEYLRADGDTTAIEQRLTVEDLIGEFMLNALRLRAGFPLALFTARTGLDPASILPRIDALRERGLLTADDGNIACTALGRRFLDSVVAEFFAS